MITLKKRNPLEQMGTPFGKFMPFFFWVVSFVKADGSALRIIPFSTWLITNGDRFRPLRIGLFIPPSKWATYLWLIHGG